MTLDERIERERQHNERLVLEIAHAIDAAPAYWGASSAKNSPPQRDPSQVCDTPLLEELRQLKRESDSRLAALEHEKQKHGTASKLGGTDFEHSPDYRWVRIHGQEFGLTSRQAQVIELLHKAYLDGTPQLGSDFILEQIGCKSSRLRDTFRSTPSAWRALIRQTRRGVVCLNL